MQNVNSIWLRRRHRYYACNSDLSMLVKVRTLNVTLNANERKYMRTPIYEQNPAVEHCSERVRGPTSHSTPYMSPRITPTDQMKRSGSIPRLPRELHRKGYNIALFTWSRSSNRPQTTTYDRTKTTCWSYNQDLTYVNICQYTRSMLDTRKQFSDQLNW